MAYDINTSKETATPRRPLLLATFTFPDASVLRVSTHNGNASDGGWSYGGNNYLPRVVEQDIRRLSWLSEQGVDRVPSATITLADPDAWVWTNYERSEGKGFKGAKLELRFVLFDVTTGEYSSDSFIPFYGICDQPSIDAQYMVISAQNRMNLTRFILPSAPLQPRCPWVNPVTSAQRAEASNPDSRFYFCGETRDTSTAPPCSYTKASCTQPSRFGGITWEPDRLGSGKEYISGSKVQWRNADTSAKYKAAIPLWLGGTAWMDVIVVNQAGDGNYTRGEAIVGLGAIDVDRVIVNGVELSMSRSGDFRWHYINRGDRDGSPNTDVPYNGNGDPYGNMTAIQFLAPRSVIDPSSTASVRVLGRCSKLRVYRRIASATGSGGGIVVTFPSGEPNEDCAGNPPFTVHISGNSWETANGDHTLTNWAYGPPGTITLSTTGSGSGTGGYLWYETSGTVPNSLGGASSPWPLMRALKWSRYSYDDFDAGSFADVARRCNELISYTDQNGNTSQQPRFTSAIALRDRRPAAEVVRGLRQAIGALLVPGSDGKLRLQIEGPLAEQQPSAPDGTNYTTPISSKTRSGSSANGYFAYLFNEGNSWGLKRTGRSASDMPNRVQFVFSDPTQSHAVSTFSLADSEDVARMDQESPGGLQVEPEGIASVNQSWRVAKSGLYKIQRGNPIGDTRGTDWWEWQTSFRGCRLAVGQIVGFDNTRLGLNKQPIRITGIKPGNNYETVSITGHSHNDDWYLDSIATDDPEYGAKRFNGRGIPGPWQPFMEQPITTGITGVDGPGTLFDGSAWTFSVRQSYQTSADGTPISRAVIVGRVPVTSPAEMSVPLVARQGTTASSGGTIPGAAGIPDGVRRLYATVVSKDSDGKLSRLSEICIIDITATGNTNTATIPVVSWDSGATGYIAYAGWSPLTMTHQKEASGTPTSITLTQIGTSALAPPDADVVKLRARGKRILHSGVVGIAVGSVATNTITVPSLASSDDWDERDISLVADMTDGSVPPWSFHATAYNNGTGAFTCSPDPNAIGVENGDVLIIRAHANIASATTIGDSKFVNAVYPDGLTEDAEIGALVRIIAGKGKGQVRRVISNTSTTYTVEPAWEATPDASSRFIVEAPDWEFQADLDLWSNSDPEADLTIKLPIDNFLASTVLVQVVSVGVDGTETPDSISPYREIYLFGQGFNPSIVTIPVTAADSPHTCQAVASSIEVDTTDGDVVIILPPQEEMIGINITVTRMTGGSYACTVESGDDDTIVGVGDMVTLPNQGSTRTFQG